MRADRAYVGSIFANYDMAAVRALPYSVAFFGEYKLTFYVRKKLSISLFVFLFNSCYAFKQGCDIVEAFFMSHFRKFSIHMQTICAMLLQRYAHVSF